MNQLMNPPKRNHWRFTNSTGLRQTIIVADTPEEAKKIFKALPADELFRIFDDVPLTAKTQDFIKDRLIFGNTTSLVKWLISLSSSFSA